MPKFTELLDTYIEAKINYPKYKCDTLVTESVIFNMAETYKKTIEKAAKDLDDYIEDIKDRLPITINDGHPVDDY